MGMAFKDMIRRCLPVFWALMLFAALAMLSQSFQSHHVPIVFDIARNPLRGKTIVLDPGHGGIDVGCGTPQGVKEKDSNLDIAHRLRRVLEEKGAKVIMTRNTDRALVTKGPQRHRRDLLKRAAIANNSAAQALVSIHVNAFEGDKHVRGPMVLFHPASSRGRELANHIQRRLNVVYRGAKGYQSYRRGAKSGDYLLLRSSRKVSVIVEVGFVTNPGDLYLIGTEDYRNKVARGIAAGLEDYFNAQAVSSFAQGSAGTGENLENAHFIERAGKLAILIRGIGKKPVNEYGILDMNRPLTFAVMPFCEYSKENSHKAFGSGHEVLVDLDGEKLHQGDHIQKAFESVPHGVGIHLHGSLEENNPALEELMEAARERSLFLTGDEGKNAAILKLNARKHGLSFHKGGEVLARHEEADSFKDELVRAGSRALINKETVVVIDFESMEEGILLQALEDAIPELEEMGIELVYLSELLGRH